MTPERLKGLISDAKQQTVEQVKAFPLTALAHIQGLASVLEALLVDISILRDDQKSAEATIAELKDNCRCPECGCATIADAESTECGCDAPVCLIEVGDTLAKAYVRLHKENDTLKGEVEHYRTQLEQTCHGTEVLGDEIATLRTRLDALVTAVEEVQTILAGIKMDTVKIPNRVRNFEAFEVDMVKAHARAVEAHKILAAAVREAKEKK